MTTERERDRAAEDRAIQECGNCHQPEDAHRGDRELEDIWGALMGCPRFVASAAAVSRYRRGRHAPLRSPLCDHCGLHGHTKKDCPW